MTRVNLPAVPDDYPALRHWIDAGTPALPPYPADRSTAAAVPVPNFLLRS
jgi:hypothetical protein